MTLHNVGNLICIIPFEMSKYSRNNLNEQSRSLLINQKNTLHLNQQKQSKVLKTKCQKQVVCNRSPVATRSTSLQTKHSSPCVVIDPLNEQCQYPFSKSEEETKAEQEDHSYECSKGQVGWTGILGQYKSEIMNYVLKRERQYCIDGSYLNHTPILSTKMRVYLVRHMFKIYHRFDLQRTTLHLAVLFLDMFFAKQRMLNDQLQGVASAQACLFIAMKYEEIYPPDLKDWVDRRHRQDVLKMEAKILAALNFQLAHYTVQHFLQMQTWQHRQNIDSEGSLTDCMADLSLFDLNIRQLPPSEVAVAIRALVKHEQPPEYKTSLAVKWMIQRNPQSLHWLREHRYGHNLSTNIS